MHTLDCLVTAFVLETLKLLLGVSAPQLHAPVSKVIDVVTKVTCRERTTEPSKMESTTTNSNNTQQAMDAQISVGGAPAAPKSQSVTMTEHWNYPLFNCLHVPVTSCVTCFCPCITFGTIGDQMGHACCCELYFFCAPIAGCVAASLRAELRERRNIPGSILIDCLLHHFCYCCALVQESRELSAIRPEPAAAASPSIVVNTISMNQSSSSNTNTTTAQQQQQPVQQQPAPAGYPQPYQSYPPQQQGYPPPQQGYPPPQQGYPPPQQGYPPPQQGYPPPQQGYPAEQGNPSGSSAPTSYAASVPPSGGDLPPKVDVTNPPEDISNMSRT